MEKLPNEVKAQLKSFFTQKIYEAQQNLTQSAWFFQECHLQNSRRQKTTVIRKNEKLKLLCEQAERPFTYVELDVGG